jgi:ubiquinone/menaquinone biosynthesis C-methylase UbiE
MTDPDRSDGFDRMYRATIESNVYREAVRASAPGLPGWLVPFSIVDGALLERIAGELRVREDDTFLDLACGAGGPGLWVAELTGASLIGVDFAPTAIAAASCLAAERGMSARAAYHVADATATGLPDASVSAVVSIDALMFVEPEAVAREIGRVLAPGGILAMTAAESLVEPFMPTLVMDYRPIFEQSGFRTISHEESPGYVDRQLAFYRALDQHAEPLRAEMGEAAEALLEEARNGLTRAQQRTIRVRQVLYVAEKFDQ